MIKENKLAPSFKIPSSNNKEFELKNNKKKFIETIDNYCKLSLIKIDYKKIKALF